MPASTATASNTMQDPSYWKQPKMGKDSQSTATPSHSLLVDGQRKTPVMHLHGSKKPLYKKQGAVPSSNYHQSTMPILSDSAKGNGRYALCPPKLRSGWLNTKLNTGTSLCLSSMPNPVPHLTFSSVPLPLFPIWRMEEKHLRQVGG